MEVSHHACEEHSTSDGAGVLQLPLTRGLLPTETPMSP